RRRASNAEAAGHSQTEKMRQIRISVDSHIFRPEELGRDSAHGDSIECRPERIDYGRAEQICIPKGRGLDKILDTRSGGRKRVLREGIRNRLVKLAAHIPPEHGMRRAE